MHFNLYNINASSLSAEEQISMTKEAKAKIHFLTLMNFSFILKRVLHNK